MSDETVGQGKPDLEALDEYLMSDESPENCMQLSDLDGFLTARVFDRSIGRMSGAGGEADGAGGTSNYRFEPRLLKNSRAGLIEANP